MKRSTKYVLFATAIALAFSACASAPEPEPEEVQQPVASDTETVESWREQAVILREQIVEAELSQYAMEEFEQGDAQLSSGDEQRALDEDAALEHYRNATESFRQVIDQAFADVVDPAQSDAQDAKSRADEVRAERGAPEPYEQGEARYTEAESARAQREFTPSLEGYRGAQESFEEAYEIASERRDRAREAMEAADQAISETEETTQELEDELDDENEEEE